MLPCYQRRKWSLRVFWRGRSCVATCSTCDLPAKAISGTDMGQTFTRHGDKKWRTETTEGSQNSFAVEKGVKKYIYSSSISIDLLCENVKQRQMLWYSAFRITKCILGVIVIVTPCSTQTVTALPSLQVRKEWFASFVANVNTNDGQRNVAEGPVVIITVILRF